MAYQMAATAVTLNNLEGHSPVGGLFKCNPSNICAAFYTISTDSVLARFLYFRRASCCYTLRISIVLGVVSCEIWQKSLKIAKKTLYVGSRSFKVIKFVTNRKGICDFLLVFNNNLGRFAATATYWSKSPLRPTPDSFNALAKGDFLRIRWWTLRCQNLIDCATHQWKRHHSYVHSCWHNTGVWWKDRIVELQNCDAL